MNLAIVDPDTNRLCVNIFKQRGDVAIVARNIKTKISSAASLGLPLVLNDLIIQKNGIVLFVGRTGSGKSTSLAVLNDHRKKQRLSYHHYRRPSRINYHTRNRSLINAKSAVIKRISKTKKIRSAFH